MRLRSGAGIGTTLVLAAIVVAGGVTDGFGTGTRLEAATPGWIPDGAGGDTFWDSPLVDIPGVSVTGLHCHGRVQYELQVGATGPSHGNPCYAAMGMYSGAESQWGVYIALPADRAVYRTSQNYQPWRYCIAGQIFGPPQTTSAPPSMPC